MHRDLFLRLRNTLKYLLTYLYTNLLTYLKIAHNTNQRKRLKC